MNAARNQRTTDGQTFGSVDDTMTQDNENKFSHDASDEDGGGESSSSFNDSLAETDGGFVADAQSHGGLLPSRCVGGRH